MPFQDDAGVNLDEHRGPLWRAFGLFGDQLERMVVINMFWAIHLLPAFAALGFSSIPFVVRLVLILYTVSVMPLVSAWMYGMIVAVSELEPVTWGLAKDVWRRQAWVGLRTLGPLVGLIGMLVWLIVMSLDSQILLLSVLLELLLIFVLVSANYWGPMMAYYPEWSAPRLLYEAGMLVWQYPAPSLLIFVAVALTSLLGVISVGGITLAVPVFVALLQTQMFLRIAPPEKEFIDNV